MHPFKTKVLGKVSKVLKCNLVPEPLTDLKPVTILSTKGCKEDVFAVAKHNRFSMPKGAMKINLPSREICSNFLEPTNETRTLDHERRSEPKKERFEG